MEASDSSELFLSSYQSARHHIIDFDTLFLHANKLRLQDALC